MEIIRKYLIEERKMPVVVAERTLEKLARHPDISNELKSWIANRTYETNTPVSVEGYTHNGRPVSFRTRHRHHYRPGNQGVAKKREAA